ncbi:class I SAM-dependent methyltransferase [Kribbella rubisoli]|nr:class I SAM-dependent methyltransferase [Kribbella rubisoli]
MPTLPPQSPPPPSNEPHRRREMAESFGADAGLYDRARPRYPSALIEAVAASAPGPAVLDVGCGTGIAARQFQAAGCQVLGVEVDERMAAFARGTGVDVEVSSFETWEPAGRTFDAVVAGMTWHWIDPSVGAAKASEVLKPGGRFAVFWYVLQPPPDLGAAFAAVHREVLPDSPVNSQVAAAPLRAYEHFLDRAADSLTATGAFTHLERPTYPWSRHYTRDEWLDQLRSSGLAKPLAEAGKLDEMLDRTGAAIDAAGGSFTLDSTAVALTATRN